MTSSLLPGKCSPFQKSLLSKERICSNRSKFFPLRVDLDLEGRQIYNGRAASLGSVSIQLKLTTLRPYVPIYSFGVFSVTSFTMIQRDSALTSCQFSSPSCPKLFCHFSSCADGVSFVLLTW